MSTRFFQELTGKACDIILRDDESEEGTLLAVDGDWLKLHNDYGKTVYLNANQIISISVEDEKEERDKHWRKWNR